MSNLTVAISPFARTAHSGHSLTDDEFYFAYLLGQGADFIFYTSDFSAKRIASKYPNGAQHLRPVAEYREHRLGHILFAMQLKIPKSAKVIFFGYTERLVLAWYLINFFKPFELFLVATNNISARRVEVYRKQLKFFLSAINAKLRRIVLHTQYEVQLVSGLAADLAEKCFVKRHHLMIPRREAHQIRTNQQIAISYFGPNKPEKPLGPLIDLIKADSGGRFRYQIFNVASDDVLRHLNRTDMPSNVAVDERWIGEDEYNIRFDSSDLVIMTHNRDFEGKLSGNLCDCVAYGVPYVSAAIEPLVSIQARYGDVGLLCEFGDPKWGELCIAQIDQDNLGKMSKNIKKMALDHTLENILYDLNLALEYD